MTAVSESTVTVDDDGTWVRITVDRGGAIVGTMKLFKAEERALAGLLGAREAALGAEPEAKVPHVEAPVPFDPEQHIAKPEDNVQVVMEES